MYEFNFFLPLPLSDSLPLRLYMCERPHAKTGFTESENFKTPSGAPAVDNTTKVYLLGYSSAIVRNNNDGSK